MKNSKEVQEFVESLYDYMDKQLNDTYKQKKENRDELLKAIAMIMLTYTIVDNVMSLSKSDYDKQYNLLLSLITKLSRSDIEQITTNATNILKNTVKNTFDFYSYNHNLKDVEKIINQNFKGKHFSSRVWTNGESLAQELTKQIQDFLKGKVNVNQIESNIKKIYNSSAYNTKRLVTTEVSRCSNQAFEEFAKKTGVKKVRYNAVLDSKTCDDCQQYNGKVYAFNNKPDLNRHPLCRCYYEIEE